MERKTRLTLNSCQLDKRRTSKNPAIRLSLRFFGHYDISSICIIMICNNVYIRTYRQCASVEPKMVASDTVRIEFFAVLLLTTLN